MCIIGKCVLDALTLARRYPPGHRQQAVEFVMEALNAISPLRGLGSRLILRGFSLFLLAIVLTPFYIRNAPFALAEVVWNLGRDTSFNDGNPFASDYPSDPQLEEFFIDPGKNKYVFFADIDGLEGA